MNMRNNMALKTRTRCYSFDQSVRKCNDRLNVNMMNKNVIIFPDRVASTVCYCSCVRNILPTATARAGFTRCSARTRDHRREATLLLLLLLLQSGAAVAVVWAHTRTLCL